MHYFNLQLIYIKKTSPHPPSWFYQPLFQQGHVFGHVVPLHLELIPLFAHGFQLAPHLPQLLLEELRGTVGLPLLLLAFELAQLLLQPCVLLLQVTHLVYEAGKAIVEILQFGLLIAACGQEFLVDCFSQGEVHLVIAEARWLGAGAHTLVVIVGRARRHHR